MEIERKFRVVGTPWASLEPGSRYRQGYLAETGGVVVRVRISEDQAWLTVKGPTRGISREEFEYTIPLAEGEMLLGLCGGREVVKTRYRWPAPGGASFEIDVFEGRNAGLVVAEIELERADEDFVRPGWLGEEVSHDARYRNSELSLRPYSDWSSESTGSEGSSPSA
ncbi:MAG: CYTH domain-containing protein [Myxococcota bacterium]|nr:CYTH domain-containing protein [Myxococcota bacterium]